MAKCNYLKCTDNTNKNCRYKTVTGFCIVLKDKEQEKTKEILSSKTKALLNIKNEKLSIHELVAMNISLGYIKEKCYLKVRDIIKNEMIYYFLKE